MKWISSAGGPLILLPSSVRNKWRGITRATSTDVSDYEAACAVRGYVGVIARHDCAILVLNDEPMDTAVVKTKSDRILLVRWMYAPSSDAVEDELQRLSLNAARQVESAHIELSNRTYYLMDAAEAGRQPAQFERVTIEPGDYQVRVVEHAPHEKMMLIIHELSKQSR